MLATISDKKFGVSSAGSSLIDHYEPDIVTAQDYFPFGMMSRVALPNSEVPYKFGFNGKMNDNDVKGGFGLQQDYGMRIYDPRVGRFLSVDPLTKDYPFLTPYAFAENDVIRSIDLDGLESYKIVGRSFAPRWAFRGTHFDARADDRTKFEIADFRKVSARIHTLIELNLKEWRMNAPVISS